ncbi:chorismate-binding protein, partial [Streptomyces sp. NPDC005921]
PYCGGVGWVDADRRTGELAVGIRTFWIDRAPGRLLFGTGAGITWGSDPDREWDETELKAARLLAIASHVEPGQTPADHLPPGSDDGPRTPVSPTPGGPSRPPTPVCGAGRRRAAGSPDSSRRTRTAG